MTKRRNVIVHIGTSADGYIARPDGDLELLTSRPKPEGFYGMSAFMKSVDTKLLGRKTYEWSLRLGAKFDSKSSRTIVFSRHAPPADAPSGVEFRNGAIGPFVSRLREQPGKDIWLMGGGELIASFLDAQAIDEFVVTVAPVFPQCSSRMAFHSWRDVTATCPWICSPSNASRMVWFNCITAFRNLPDATASDANGGLSLFLVPSNVAALDSGQACDLRCSAHRQHVVRGKNRGARLCRRTWRKGSAFPVGN